MAHRFQFATYRRPFAVPLRTARGVWYEREGILLRLETEDGRVGYGEVSPVDGFGTESLDHAESFLASLRASVDESSVLSVPENLRCCRFALGSAWWQLEAPDVPYSLGNTALLPTGEMALEAMVRFLEEGFLSFKIKIGVAPAREELANVQALLSLMPAEARLRVDANGALDEAGTGLWLDALNGHRGIEFLEQPMEAGAERRVRDLAGSRDVAVALDESLSTVDGVRVVLGHLRWPGPLVLKSALMGFPAELLRTLQSTSNPLIFSSVFETGIGLHSGLRLAAAAGARVPVGYGTLAYFADGLNLLPCASRLESTAVTAEALEHLWQTVCEEFARA